MTDKKMNWLSAPAIVAVVVLAAMSCSLQGCDAAKKALHKIHHHLQGWKQKQCECFDDWNYKGPDGKGKEVTYHGCSATPDFKGAQWCYVKGGSQCSEAKKSDVPDEDRRWLQCDSCACMGEWTYKGPDGKGKEVTLNGCAETDDWKGHSWCYVVDSAKCATANPSKVPKETKKFIECGDACACDDGKFKYKGKEYEGCVATPDFKDHTWCYAVGGGSCTTAKKSEVKGETKMYVMCDPCQCMSSWMYKGNKGKDPEKEFFGCAATPDWKDHNWCYVQGGAECSKAKDSETKGETRKFIECDAKAEEKFLISQDEPVESSSNFGTMCLAAFAGTAVLGGLAFLSFKRIQRGRARENPVSASAEGGAHATETPMLVRNDLDPDYALE